MRWFLRKYRSTRLRFRVASGAFVIGALLVVVVVQASVVAREDGLRQQFDRRAETVLDVVAAMSREPLLTAEYGQHNELLQQLRAEEDIESIDLIDSDGQIVSSTDRAHIGLDGTAVLAARSSSHHDPLIEKTVMAVSGEIGTVRVFLDRTNADRLLADERRRGLVSGFLGVAAIALVSLFGGWVLTRRISDLESQLHNVDADGLPYPVETSGNDEIARLGDALNQRTNRIREVSTANAKGRDDLRISEAKLQLALATAADAVVEFDLEAGEFTVIATSGARHLLRAMPLAANTGFIEVVHHEDRELLAALISEVASGSDDPTNGGELEIRAWSEHRKHWRNVLLRLHATSSTRVLIAGVDVTDQRQVDRRLAQSERMQAIGLLTAGIAHDFNNALAVSRLHLSVLDRSDRDRTKDDERIEQLSLANESASAIVKRLLVAAAPQQTEPRRVDLVKLIRSLDGLVRTILGPTINFGVDSTAEESTVFIDEAGAQQAIMNLAKNAADAVDGVGQVRIKIRNPDTNSITIEVTDDGPGIDPSIAESLFEPFVTTKAVGAGTGLGLATAYDTVTAAGGSIVASNPGHGGASFLATLPLAPIENKTVESTNESTSESSHDVRSAAKRILVVDDNEALLVGLAAMLQDNGHDVATATCAQDALDLVTAPGLYDLLLTDIGLPDFSGFELRARVAALDPKIGVVYMSAILPDDPRAPRIGGAFLQKPFNEADVLASIGPAHP